LGFTDEHAKLSSNSTTESREGTGDSLFAIRFLSPHVPSIKRVPG